MTCNVTNHVRCLGNLWHHNQWPHNMYSNKNIYDRFVRDYFSFLISLMNWLICHVLFTRRIARLTFLTTRIGSKRRFTFCSETKLERTRNSRVCWVFADTLLPLPLVTYSHDLNLSKFQPWNCRLVKIGCHLSSLFVTSSLVWCHSHVILPMYVQCVSDTLKCAFLYFFLDLK